MMPREKVRCKYYQSAQDRECLLTNGKCVDDDIEPCVDYTVDEIEQLNEEVAMLKKENEELEQELEACRDANVQKKKRIATLEDALKRAEGKVVSVEELQKERDSLQKAHNYNIDKIASLEDALKRAEGKVVSVEEIFDYLSRPELQIRFSIEERRKIAQAIHALLATRKGSER